VAQTIWMCCSNSCLKPSWSIELPIDRIGSNRVQGNEIPQEQPCL
jgi:hypothetical protein